MHDGKRNANNPPLITFDQRAKRLRVTLLRSPQQFGFVGLWASGSTQLG
jgi:hypothetical protein